MSSELSHIPAGYHSVTPSLTVKDGRAALAFYARAFDAVERFRLTDPKTGGIAHAEFAIGDSTLMLSDEYPEWGCLAPEIGEGGSFMIYVADVEDSFLRAVNAGVTVVTPPADQFYGDRSARLADPFGYRWTLAQRIREVPMEEMEKSHGRMHGRPGQGRSCLHMNPCANTKRRDYCTLNGRVKAASVCPYGNPTTAFSAGA